MFCMHVINKCRCDCDRLERLHWKYLEYWSWELVVQFHNSVLHQVRILVTSEVSICDDDKLNHVMNYWGCINSGVSMGTRTLAALGVKLTEAIWSHYSEAYPSRCQYYALSKRFPCGLSTFRRYTAASGMFTAVVLNEGMRCSWFTSRVSTSFVALP